MTKKIKEENIETTVDTTTVIVASRTKRVNLTSQVPTEENGYTLNVSAEVIGTDSAITFSKQTPVVDQFWGQALVSGIKERFNTVIAGASGVPEAIVEKLTAEVIALDSGEYASRASRGAAKTDFINTVIAIAFVAKFGESVKVNEDNFNEVFTDLVSLQAADAEYEALTKEEKAAKVKDFSKVAAGISYFRNAL